MIGIPFGIRPAGSSMSRTAEQKKEMKHEEAFSDMFTSLLTLVLKDGFANRSVISLLKDVYPYAEAGDRRQIERLLCAGNRADELKTKEKFPCYASLISKPPLSKTDRLLGMMNVLRKYSRKDTEDVFTMIERMIKMSQMMKKGTNDPMNMIMQMLPKGSFGDIAGMMEMIKRMS